MSGSELGPWPPSVEGTFRKSAQFFTLVVFQVTQVENEVDDRIYRRVTGTFTIPSYLTGDGSPGNQFAYAPGAGPDALPIRNGNVSAGFICNIPRSTTAMVR